MFESTFFWDTREVVRVSGVRPSVGKIERKVVCEDAEEDGADQRALRDIVGQWKG